MTQHHRMSVAEYEAKLVNRMRVEKRREQEYQQSKHMVAEMDSQLRK